MLTEISSTAGTPITFAAYNGTHSQSLARRTFADLESAMELPFTTSEDIATKGAA
jgi:hypothetical protein